MGVLDTHGETLDVMHRGGLIYLADGSGGLRLVDGTNPAKPEELGDHLTLGDPGEVKVVGSLAYVATGRDVGWKGGLEIIDVADPSAPFEVGSFEVEDALYGEARAVEVVGDLAYLAGNFWLPDWYSTLRIVDVSDPALPSQLGVYEHPADTGYGLGDVAVAGTLAFLADGSAGLRIVSVANPAAPVGWGGFNKPGGYVAHVEVEDGLAYVADRSFGLRIVDVSDLLNLPQIGSLAMPGGPRHVALVDGLAYLIDGYYPPFHHLRIVDVSNPALPVEIGAFDTLEGKGVVTVVDELAYLSGGYSGVRVVDVSNPQAGVELGAFTRDRYWAGNAVVVDGLTYVARSNSLQIIDFGPEYQRRCQNGLDDDGDGFVDFPADPGCADPLDLSETNPAVDCDDGFDNDGDGRADFDPVTFANPGDQYTAPSGSGDPGCKDPSWNTENPRCQDGINNDPGQDPDPGRIDYDAGYFANGSPHPNGPDPQCIGKPWKKLERSTETVWPCGLGSELALLLPPLMWLWEKKSRRRKPGSSSVPKPTPLGQGVRSS
jgi:hypothetical protein